MVRQGGNPSQERRSTARRRGATAVHGLPATGAVLVAAAGCAFMAGTPPLQTAVPSVVDQEEARVELGLAEADYTQGRFAAAAVRGDSIDAAWREIEALRPLADRALSLAARALEAQGLPGAAADRYATLLARAPAPPLEAIAQEELRRLRPPLAVPPAVPEPATAGRIPGADTDRSGDDARIGAILPLTGELSGVGQALREGIELAVERYRDQRPDGFELELLVVDDASDPAHTPDLVQSLEGRGVVAIVGPLRAESFAAASRARRNPELPIVSPTAMDVLRPAPAAYTLFDAGTRASDVAEALARWTLEELRLRRVAVLEPDGVGLGEAVSAFIRTVGEYEGVLVGHERYDPGLTTFRGPIEAIAASRPDVVFAPAASASGVLAIAPQLFYYGLYDAVVIGSEAWAEPAVLRRLERFATDHRVVGLTMDRVGPDTPWRRFEADYERRYRKALRENIMPALAHDAMLLVLEALDGAGRPVPAALSAYLESGPEVEGVTGRLRPEAGRSIVRRATEVHMLVDGSPVEADREALLAWLAQVRASPSPFAPRDTLRTEARHRMGVTGAR